MLVSIPVLGPLVRFKDLFPDAHGGWGHLNQLILSDKLDGLLQAKNLRWNELQGIVRPCCPHVGEFLLLDHINIQIVLLCILTNHHPLVDRCVLLDKECAPGLEVKKRVRGRLSWPVRNKGSGRAFCDRAMPRLIPIENVVEESCPSCIGEKLRTKPDQSSGWDPEFEANPAVADCCSSSASCLYGSLPAGSRRL